MLQLLHTVTGAFGYAGQAIARRLLAAGIPVRTLTNSPRRPSPLAGRIDIHPLAFDNPNALARSLEGVAVLYNTYWVRFNYGTFSHAQAVRNTQILFDAARRAGVGRIIHISITNPSESSSLEYFRGKAILECALRDCGLSHAILRPAVLFGHHDILINNIAWMLRRFPIFAVPGDGLYRLQPIHVDDLAQLATDAASASQNFILNAIGPETFTFRQLVQQIGHLIGHPRPIVSLAPRAVHLITRAISAAVGDVVLTWEEVQGLMAGLLHVDASPTGSTRLTDWARDHAATLGTRYASELARRSGPAIASPS